MTTQVVTLDASVTAGKVGNAAPAWDYKRQHSFPSWDDTSYAVGLAASGSAGWRDEIVIVVSTPLAPTISASRARRPHGDAEAEIEAFAAMSPQTVGVVWALLCAGPTIVISCKSRSPDRQSCMWRYEREVAVGGQH